MLPRVLQPVFRPRRRGVSLIEVVMVTVIIGILVSLAVPTFHRAIEQSRADVAAANLRAIWSAQRLYWLANRSYAADLQTLYSQDLLDSNIANQDFYNYEISYGNGTNFTALAVRVTNGSWNGTLAIDQSGTVSGVLASNTDNEIVPSY
jgi:prepilin-type N-terminal cleavage/methylation domain-containing protein